ncbi:hypothetical protein CPC08DRAFT_754755 [Agrocybe pediades]|nr:hypothetical protein CPC08DRAFT_754755 [Agrocybe pediades]
MFLKEALLLLTLWATHVLALDFTSAKWIWTNETGITLQAPSGSRAFRRDYQTPVGKSALSASVLIAADDAYTLYVNGQQIGTGSNSSVAQAYCVSLSPSFNVFAVNVTNAFNVPNPATNTAGLLSAIQIQYTDGSIDTIVTDSSWRATPHVPAGFPPGFQLLGYNDTTWPAATVEANYGDAPWGVISIPPSTSSRPLSLTDANWIWTNEV